MKFEKVDINKCVHIPSKRPKASKLIEVWKSEDYLVQIYKDHNGWIRLSINRVTFTLVNNHPIWQDGITWDDLYNIKNDLGFHDKWLVECYPPEDELVNVANIRHLFVLDEPPKFGFHSKDY